MRACPARQVPWPDASVATRSSASGMTFDATGLRVCRVQRRTESSSATPRPRSAGASGATSRSRSRRSKTSTGRARVVAARLVDRLRAPRCRVSLAPRKSSGARTAADRHQPRSRRRRRPPRALGGVRLREAAGLLVRDSRSILALDEPLRRKLGYLADLMRTACYYVVDFSRPGTTAERRRMTCVQPELTSNGRPARSVRSSDETAAPPYSP